MVCRALDVTVRHPLAVAKKSGPRLPLRQGQSSLAAVDEDDTRLTLGLELVAAGPCRVKPDAFSHLVFDAEPPVHAERK